MKRTAWLESWAKFRERIPVGSNEEVVQKAFAPIARDQGMLRSDGNNRALVFLIDDIAQVQVNFDHENKVVWVSWPEQRRKWLKHPDGIIEFVDEDHVETKPTTQSGSGSKIQQNGPAK